METFSRCDALARSFYEEHGYLVLAPQLTPAECAALRAALDRLWQRYAGEQRMSLDHYLAHISQWRDLWRWDERFRSTIEAPRLWSPAAELMGRGGARLLHDHVIAKPSGQSDTVPWHQDYPYWPVDTPEGLSCWCPIEDVGTEGGCLEVIDGSHRWGENPPVDFIADAHPEFDDHPARVRLPASAGSIVILNSLTWHRTGPNREAGRRRVYISLWLPPEARYAPDHSAWHPVNEHVTVASGEILNDDWFPRFGEPPRSQHVAARPSAPDGALTGQGSGTDQGNGRGPHPGGAESPSLSMFNASEAIAAQLRAILVLAGYPADLRGGIGTLLAIDGATEAIVRQTLATGLIAHTEVGALHGALDRMRIGSEAFRLHRARNVYNAAYVEWWQLAGSAWAEHLGRGSA